MNEHISIQDLETLTAHQGKPAVSIYLPTMRIPTRVQAESLQLRNLLRDAEIQLEQFELRGPDIRAILEPARELIADSDFWRHQKDGLALFLAQDTFLRYQLPFTFDIELIVAQAFHLKPLMPSLTDSVTFYILAVSQNRVRLLRCTRDSVQELDPATIPDSLQEVLGEYDLEKQVQYHTSSAAPGTGRRGAIFYGTGAGATEDEKAKIREYFDRINHGLRDYLQGQSAPLVFAGVEYLFPIYRDANTYPNLVESSITGNPDELHADALHRQAWKLIEPSFNTAREADIEQYHNLAAHGLTSTQLEELVPWADKGRVEVAFIDKQASVWGVYDTERFEVKVDDAHMPDNRDLTDMVALYTLLRKGNVYLLTPEEMEMEFGQDNRHRSNNGNSQNSVSRPAVAAIYRFAL
jgi:hypothetical protein